MCDELNSYLKGERLSLSDSLCSKKPIRGKSSVHQETWRNNQISQYLHHRGIVKRYCCSLRQSCIRKGDLRLHVNLFATRNPNTITNRFLRLHGQGSRANRDLHARGQWFREKERRGKESKKAPCVTIDVQGACNNLTKHDGLHGGSHKKFISME